MSVVHTSTSSTSSTAVSLKLNLFEENTKSLEFLKRYLNDSYKKIYNNLNEVQENNVDDKIDDEKDNPLTNLYNEFKTVCEEIKNVVQNIEDNLQKYDNDFSSQMQENYDKNEVNVENVNNENDDNLIVEISQNSETENINDKIQKSDCNLKENESTMKENKQNSDNYLNQDDPHSQKESETIDDSEKENKNEEKNIPRKIRLVAIEKLLDPKIMAVESQTKNSQLQPKLPTKQTVTHSDASVIILEDSDEEDNIPVASLMNNSNTKLTTITLNSDESTIEVNEQINLIEVDETNNDFSEKTITKKKNSENTLGEKNTSTQKSHKQIDSKKCKRCYLRIKKNPQIEELIKNSQKQIPLNDIKTSSLLSSSSKHNQIESNRRQSKNSSSDLGKYKRSRLRTRKMSNSDMSNDEGSVRKNANAMSSSAAPSSSEAEDEKSSLKATDGECTSMGGLKFKILLKTASKRSDKNQLLENGNPNNQNDTDEEENNTLDSEDENESSKRKTTATAEESSGESVILKKRRNKTENSAMDKKRKTDETSDNNTQDDGVDNSSDDDDDDSDEEERSKKKKRRKRIRTVSGSDDSDSDKDSPNKKRKNIRKLIKTKDLDSETKLAAREEEERRKRIEERQKLYNEYYEKPESVEINELVLDFDEKTKVPLLKVDDGLLKKLKPHQANGVKFMWDACYETIKDANKKTGSGCILAHCMGLGKTLQIVTLVHTLLTNSNKTNVEKVLIISPLSTLNNWAREFSQWLKFCKNKNIEVYDMSRWKDKKARIFKLNEWFEEGGVCILGYDMFRILSSPTGKSKKQRENLQKCLVEPGPDLVVCDEGHLLKNEKTSLSKSVNKMKTLRRIILTGTPLQNNLKEYYCMIQFIKPNLLGTYKEYMNRFVNPITNGQYTDSTERDIRLMKHRSHVLHKLLEGCIQRRDYSVLAPYLPPKHEYVVFIQLTELQQKLYELYMTTQKDLIGDQSGKGAKLFQDFCNLRRIWTHPLALKMDADSAYKKKLEKAMFFDDDDEVGSLKDFIDDDDQTTPTNSESGSDSCNSDKSELSAKKNKTGRGIRRTRQNANQFDDEDDVELSEKGDERPPEWWSAECSEDTLKSIYESPKLLLLLHILQECEKIGDKILLFSQSLQSLDIIEHFLSLIDRKTNGEEIDANIGSYEGSWAPGLDYFRLDGSRTVDNRDAMCKSFNDPSNLRSRLFLISTRAGGLGINLVAANRVIIFDVSWNPSHDTQSIFRVYRFGQNKPCYIYRFIALGTMEEKVYERQVTKQATAKRVLDEQQISRHYNQNDLLELYNYELKPSKPREIPVLPKDRLFADLLSTHEKLIYKYHEHDSLLENEESENLSEEERKAAWEEFEAEKNRPAYQPYIRTNYNSVNGPVTSSKIFGFRTDVLLRLLNLKVSQDHPDIPESQVYQMVPDYMQRLYSEINENVYTLYNELLKLCSSLQVPPSGYYMNPTMQHPIGGMNIQHMTATNMGTPGVNMTQGINPYWLTPQQQQQQQQRNATQSQQQLLQRQKQNITSNPLPSTSSSEVYEID